MQRLFNMLKRLEASNTQVTTSSQEVRKAQMEMQKRIKAIDPADVEVLECSKHLKEAVEEAKSQTLPGVY